MAVLNSEIDVARRSDGVDTKSEFSRHVAKAHQLLAIMEAQQLRLDSLVAESLNAVHESRALLMGID